MTPENDPKLHTLEGIAEALDEAEGERGIAIEWGWVRLATAYPRTSRILCSVMSIDDVRTARGPVDLWVTITVIERDVIDFLHADAAQHLKPGLRYELRKQHPTNFGRTHGMAWYRNSAMDKRETWGNRPAQAAGYYLVGEFVTPSEP